MIDFEPFPKITRLFEQDVVLTEKLDGTNGVIRIEYERDYAGCLADEPTMLVGSRNRWITPEDDNYGFARWCEENKEELLALGEGTHYGEWWGQGIQRKYGMDKKVFSLFNVDRWSDDSVRPDCCDVVPTIYVGPLTAKVVEEFSDPEVKWLSQAALKYDVEYDNPEGYMAWMSKGRQYCKIPLNK